MNQGYTANSIAGMASVPSTASVGYAKDPIRQGAITRQIERLEQQSEVLEREIGALIDRASVFTAPRPPQPPMQSGVDKVARPDAPLANGLGEIVARLDVQITRVRDLREAIDL